jgi:hypothetical protein
VSTFSKRAQAEEIAGAIIEQRDTDVTLADIARMRDADVYDWLENFGFTWDDVEHAWRVSD